jgi:class 3 adenylate cyclase/tetratricopeptide (TPR) repeat protein
MAVPAAPAPDTYTPRHLAERILTSKGAVEGERKQVTVLFADLKGSMELLGDRDPEDARKLLDPVLERMMDAVHHYEGTVNQVMGDGIMALFGAPLAHEDHAVRACYAALRMQDSVRRYSEELRRGQGVEVQIRVGLNSGDVVVRSVGSDLRMDYSAVGQTTNLAARMEQLAAPGSIRLAPETVRLAEGFVQVASLGPVPVKGLVEPVEVFELTGAGAARSRLEVAARRGLTRFVGRGAEMDQLRDALDRARGGQGQVVAVVGEPGVGKSRLFWELTHSHRVQGWLVLQSASVSYGKASAYQPVIDLLRRYFEIDSRDDVRRVREKITGKVLTLAPALAPSMPAFLALLDAPVDDPAWQGLDPIQRRHRTLDAIKALLLRESEVQPLVVVFEDLHWVDGETQAVLEALVDSVPTARVGLLVNYRPEYRHQWGSKTFYRQLRIDPLAPESADELLDALLGADPALGALKRLLVERTEANPLFVEESIRTLVETGALAGERGAHRLIRPVESLAIPATVQAILAARIDRLPPDTKRLLQAAAVIGKDVPMALLLAVAEASERDVRAELTRLQAAEFLYEARLFPDLEYTFKHALTHEVAYAGLLHERQRSLHGRIAEAIERLAGERVAEQAERLAHHAVRGERWEQAVRYLHQAGLRAMTRAASREASAHFEQALAVLGRLPEAREHVERTIDLRIELRHTLLLRGDRARMREHLQAAEALARGLDDRRRLGRIATFMVIDCLGSGEYDRGIAFAREALGIGRALGDRSVEVTAASFLGMVHVTRGEFRDAVPVLEGNLALIGDQRLERFGAPLIQSGLVRALLADAFSQLGRFDEAVRHAEEAVRVGDEVDQPLTLYWGLLDLGLAHFRRGTLARAIQTFERCLDICRSWQLVVGQPAAAAALGAVYALTGRSDEGLPLVLEALEASRASASFRWAGQILMYAATAHLAAGRRDEAARLTDELLDLTRHLGTDAHLAHALRLAGDVAAARGATGADAYYRAALPHAEPRGMRPLVAHVHLGLGRLGTRERRGAEAREHLLTAAALYREMGMPVWLAEAETALRERA